MLRIGLGSSERAALTTEPSLQPYSFIWNSLTMDLLIWMASVSQALDYKHAITPASKIPLLYSCVYCLLNLPKACRQDNLYRIWFFFCLFPCLLFWDRTLYCSPGWSPLSILLLCTLSSRLSRADLECNWLVQGGFELVIFLPPPLKHWDYRLVPPWPCLSNILKTILCECIAVYIL